MRPRFFEHTPERDAAYRFRPVFEYPMPTPTQQAPRQERVRTTHGLTGRTSTLHARSRVGPTSTSPIRRPTGDSQDDDELAALISRFNSAMQNFHTFNPARPTTNAERMDFRRFLNLVYTARDDVLERRNPPLATLEEMEVWQYRLDRRTERSWTRMEEIHELSLSLNVQRTYSVHRLGKDCLTKDSLPESTVARIAAACRPFRCPICFETGSNPLVVVPCGHVLCEPCLWEMHGIAKSEKKQMRCHFCRQDAGTFTDWETLRNVYGLEEQGAVVEMAAGEHGQDADERGGINGGHEDIDPEEGGGQDEGRKRGSRGVVGFIRQIRDWVTQICAWFGR